MKETYRLLNLYLLLREKNKSSDAVSYMTWSLALFSYFCVKKIFSRQAKGRRGLEA